MVFVCGTPMSGKTSTCQLLRNLYAAQLGEENVIMASLLDCGSDTVLDWWNKKFGESFKQSLNRTQDTVIIIDGLQWSYNEVNEPIFGLLKLRQQTFPSIGGKVKLIMFATCEEKVKTLLFFL